MPPTPRQSVDDIAFIMGIPAAEFTPKVEEAVAIIMGEFDRQRAELDHARERIAYLEEQVDIHDFLPVPNRRAFLRTLSMVQGRMEQTRSALLVLNLRNAGAIRQTLGRAALDIALTAFASVLQEGVRGSDWIGNLGGADFGVILTFTAGSAAVEKATELADRLRQAPVEWNGHAIAIEVWWGLCDFSGNETIRAVLDSAENDLLRRGRGAEP